MLLSKFFNKKTLVLLTGILLLALLTRGVLSFFASTVAVTVSGEHSAVDNYLFINNKRVYPVGGDGKEYTGRLKAGDNSLELRGPMIVTAQAKVTAGLIGDSQKIELTTTSTTPEKVLQELFNDPKATFSYTRYFPESRVIISFKESSALQDDEDEASYATMLYYDQNSSEWKEITREFTAKQSAFVIESAAINYFYELDNE